MFCPQRSTRSAEGAATVASQQLSRLAASELHQAIDGCVRGRVSRWVLAVEFGRRCADTIECYDERSNDLCWPAVSNKRAAL